MKMPKVKITNNPCFYPCEFWFVEDLQTKKKEKGEILKNIYIHLVAALEILINEMIHISLPQGEVQQTNYYWVKLFLKTMF